MKVLVTGSTGFVGSALLAELTTRSCFVPRAAVRKNNHHFPSTVGVHVVGNIGPETIWKDSLQGVDVIVHAAAHVHVDIRKETSTDLRFYQVNVDGTYNLARQAAASKVKRFVFLSSVGVNGAQSSSPFTELDAPNPVGPYAVSKMEAEKKIKEVCNSGAMEFVIIRPPLIYGPNAPGNFGKLLAILNKRVPLPFSAIQNKRSFIALDNLIDLIVRCLCHPHAGNEIFLAGDGEDISTTGFLELLGEALGKPAILFHVPERVVVRLASMIGRHDIHERLYASLQTNITKSQKLLGWRPPLTLKEGVRKSAGWSNRAREAT